MIRTKAVRLYGQKDLRLEEFDLPLIKEDEILARVVSDSICMSSYKASMQGTEHKRVPEDISTNPIIIGHEFCGIIEEVGKKWSGEFKAGDKFSIQPALNWKESPFAAPGYSFSTIGGDATYIIIPNIVMEQKCLLPYKGEAFFYGSLAEPVSCIVGAYHAQYHTVPGEYTHHMGIAENGKMAILAGVGPMGLGAIDYALNRERRPGLLVVTDIDDLRLKRAAELYSVQDAAKKGVKLLYVNTSQFEKPVDHLLSLTDGTGYDDVMVFAPVKSVVELGDKLLARDGCLNFFAGPNNPEFSAEFNFYNVHYNSTHIVGTSGGNTEDMKEALHKMSLGIINPAAMITHVGGLNCVVETTLNLPHIPGGKKLIYTGIDMPLTAISDFDKLSENDPFYKQLAEVITRHGGLWSEEAEKWLLSNAKPI
jgi:threonine dehydrogenase-like Zn-dependent dehydrogenase